MERRRTLVRLIRSPGEPPPSAAVNHFHHRRRAIRCRRVHPGTPHAVLAVAVRQAHEENGFSHMPHDIKPTGNPGEIATLLHWNADGMIAVIAQAHDTGEVLMFAYATREALAQTLATGIATYFSRSRGGLWVKGETSGYKQRVVEVRTDCDGDCVLYRVDAPGPACHQLRRSCFSNRIANDGSVHCDKPIIA